MMMDDTTNTTNNNNVDDNTIDHFDVNSLGAQYCKMPKKKTRKINNIAEPLLHKVLDKHQTDQVLYIFPAMRDYHLPDPIVEAANKWIDDMANENAANKWIDDMANENAALTHVTCCQGWRKWWNNAM